MLLELFVRCLTWNQREAVPAGPPQSTYPARLSRSRVVPRICDMFRCGRWSVTVMVMAALVVRVCGQDGIPVCGDLVVEGDEECDDGNLIDKDGCSDTCKVNSVAVSCAAFPGRLDH